MVNFELSAERKLLFDVVKAATMSAPRIYELTKLDLPHDNRIVVADFSQQPGSHYRGVFVQLIRRLEEDGIKIDDELHRVTPETAVLVEPTTGNAGEDLAIAGKLLGYNVYIIMPDGLPESRYKYMEKYGAEIIRTPADKYVIGMRQELIDILGTNREWVSERPPRGSSAKSQFYASPNHSGSDTGEITTKHMGKMVDRLVEVYGKNIDFAVIGFGNGASLLGPGRRLKEEFPGVKIFAVEPFATGLAYEMWRPGRYKDWFGIDPANPELLRNNRLYGLNAPIVEDVSQQGIVLPLQRRAIDEVVNRIEMVIDDAIISSEVYENLSNECRNNVAALVGWDKTHRMLLEKGHNFGHSSAACIGVAMRKLREVSLRSHKDNLTAFTIVYDDMKKYA